MPGRTAVQMKAAFLCTTAVMATTFAFGTPAQAHFLGRYSVDRSTTPPEIRYEEYSKWNDAIAVGIAGWENLIGGVNIAPDIASTISDLTVEDYYSSADGLCGVWNQAAAADWLSLNDYYYNRASTLNRRACALHEWGHAHGLAHSSDSQVMDDCPVTSCPGGTAYTTPQNHDRVDYYELW
jgi:hypothetical protein